MHSRARITASLSGRVKKYDKYDSASRTKFIPDPAVPEVVNARNVEPSGQLRSRETAPKSAMNSENTLALHTVRSAKFNKYTQFESQIIPINHKQSTGWLLRFFYGVGLSVFVATMAVSAQVFLANHQDINQADVLSAQTASVDKQGVQQGTESNPAEDIPGDSAFFAYNVASAKPRYLRVPSIGAFSRVKEVGQSTNGSVGAPSNVHDVSWYSGSVLPGSESGISLLIGHESGGTVPGVFKSVRKLAAGSIVEIETGRGDVLSYEVEQVKNFPMETFDIADILREAPTNTHSLRLVTSAREYSQNSESDNLRTVVYANPVN
jgi:hypothetical protein